MMTELYKKGNKYLRIIRDEYGESPRTMMSNLGHMVTWHRNYNLGDEQPTISRAEYARTLPQDISVLPLYLMDHSGLSMRVTPFSCKWDSGHVGYIHTTPAKLLEFGVGPEHAEARLTAEVERYSQYLEGEVYGYVIFEKVMCDTCGHIEEKELDSIHGFYGWDHHKNGLFAHTGEGWEPVEL